MPRARTAVVAILALPLIAALSGCRGSPPQSTLGSDPTPTASAEDRLAAPELPANPDQADLGAYTYWAHCMACHGDRGQGLTAEFRALYPPEDRNCWESGCHGARPYENGFTLPATVPALVGPGHLASFGDAAGLQGFIAAAMPWSAPGSLSQEEYWQVTAFLLRENGQDPGATPLGPENAGAYRFSTGRGPSPQTPTPNLIPSPTSSSEPGDLARARGPLVVVGLLLMIAWWLRVEKQRRDRAKKD